MNLEGEVGHAVQKRTTEDFTYVPDAIKVVDKYEPLFVLLSKFSTKSIIFNYYILIYGMIKNIKLHYIIKINSLILKLRNILILSQKYLYNYYCSYFNNFATLNKDYRKSKIYEQIKITENTNKLINNLHIYHQFIICY